MDGILLLLVAGTLFALTHLGLSSATMRPMLVKVMGEGGFLGVYSLVSFATLGAMIWQYGQAGRDLVLWAPSMVAITLAKLIMPFSLILVVLGLTTKNPTALKQESALEDEPAGVLRITRHPLQWGILLWALSHLIANGDLASIVFIAPIALVSGFGTMAIDAKKARTLDAAKWKRYTEKTSNLPFLAIAQGRNEFRFGELGTGKLLVALVLLVLLVYFHDFVAGVPLYDF